MKKTLCILLTLCLMAALAACGGDASSSAPETTEAPQPSETPAPTPAAAETAAEEWTAEGFFTDEDGNMLSIAWMNDVDEPGWYTACVLGEDWIDNGWAGYLTPEDGTLRGTLASNGDEAPLNVTVSEDGGTITFAVEGGGTWRFTEMELEEASIFVSVNTEGWGNIDYAEGEEAPEIDTEYPFQSAQINLAEPATYTFVAWTEPGVRFVKWTKNGEDFSDEAQITVLLDESADFVAVFEDDPDWQNPVMNFVGEYQCDRAHATVECFGKTDAWIVIEWGSSAWELAHWDIVGTLDTETLTIEYSNCTRQTVTFDDSGEVASQETVYDDGTGSITFHEDGSFTWHDDRSENENDMVFEWMRVEE